eukprot:346573-Rhodomonas_salina.1
MSSSAEVLLWDGQKNAQHAQDLLAIEESIFELQQNAHNMREMADYIEGSLQDDPSVARLLTATGREYIVQSTSTAVAFSKHLIDGLDSALKGQEISLQLTPQTTAVAGALGSFLSAPRGGSKTGSAAYYLPSRYAMSSSDIRDAPSTSGSRLSKTGRAIARFAPLLCSALLFCAPPCLSCLLLSNLPVRVPCHATLARH